jgi:hypothetical protein
MLPPPLLPAIVIVIVSSAIFYVGHTGWRDCNGPGWRARTVVGEQDPPRRAVPGEDLPQGGATRHTRRGAPRVSYSVASDTHHTLAQGAAPVARAHTVPTSGQAPAGTSGGGRRVVSDFHPSEGLQK